MSLLSSAPMKLANLARSVRAAFRCRSPWWNGLRSLDSWKVSQSGCRYFRSTLPRDRLLWFMALLLDFIWFRADVRLDLQGIGELVHLVVKPDDRQHLPEAFRIESQFLHGGRVAVDAIAA